WTPTVKTSFAGAYAHVSYDSQATNWFAGQVCGVGGTGAATSTSFAVAAGGNCNPNFSYAQGGVRTMWTPVPGFFLAVESFYSYVWTAFGGTNATVGTAGTAIVGARPSGLYAIDNRGTWGFIFRAQRNFNAGD